MVKQQKIIAMTGATGFVGTHLQKRLRDMGWRIISISRADFQGEDSVLAGKLAGADIVINLAGAPVIGRWTEQFKKTLFESRVSLTRKLVAAISLMDKKPEVFISTSAIGIYASEGEHTEEKYIRANTFLGRLASSWEEAAFSVEKLGVRTVILRLGLVFGKGGGVLQKMILPFKLGLGGTIGNGEQDLCWIHINDLVQVYELIVNDVSYSGIFNLVAPKPTTNNQFTKELGRTLSRPTIIPIPTFILKLLLGEGAEVLTSGQKVYPKRLIERGFTFQFSQLRDALRNCVN